MRQTVRAPRFVIAAFLALTSVAAQAQAEDAPISKAEAKIEATKASQREILRQLKIVPRASEAPPDLDEVILDWTEDGYVRAARVSGADGVEAPPKQSTSLAILRSLPKLKALELSGIVVTDLRALTSLSKLEELRITACDGMKPVAEVTRLRGLQRLTLSNMKLGDTAALKALSKMTELDLLDTDLTNLAFVTAMPKLGRLVVPGSAELKDLGPISKLKWLRVLDVSRTGVVDLAPLAGLVGLTSLKVPRGLDLGVLEKLVADGCKIEEI